MKKHFTILSVFLLFVVSVSAQTYVWKNGLPVLTDPDSITFSPTDMGARIQHIEESSGAQKITFLYRTKDYESHPIWMSALLSLTKAQISSKHIGKMALYNHYTIMRADECPTSGVWDLQMAADAFGMSVVCADYEGFGQTADRAQAYCFGEANARASIDALLAAREWLVKQGYTLSDTIINYGYSQGGQTTVAALKLSQTEYRGKVRFYKNIAGASPIDLTLTFRKFLEWKKLGISSILPLTVITLNELLHWNLDYTTVFEKPLADNWKMWFLSKKFDTNEAATLMGTDSIPLFMKPVYCDSTSNEVRSLLQYADQLNITKNWTPDPDTKLKIYHSKNDDIVSFDNSRNLYQFFVDQGCNNVVIDSTSLTSTHMSSGMSFLIGLAVDFQE